MDDDDERKRILADAEDDAALTAKILDRVRSLDDGSAVSIPQEIAIPWMYERLEELRLAAADGPDVDRDEVPPNKEALDQTITEALKQCAAGEFTDGDEVLDRIGRRLRANRGRKPSR